jgi:hypothetical protein
MHATNYSELTAGTRPSHSCCSDHALNETLTAGALGNKVALRGGVPSEHRTGVSVLYLWPRGRSTGFDTRPVTFTFPVRAGPKDDYIEVVLELPTTAGKTEKDTKASALAKPDATGDFLPDIDGDPFCFDLVHTFTVARLTLAMIMHDLDVSDWRWNWDRNLPSDVAKSPLRVICHAGEKSNATYHRGKRAVKFYQVTLQQKTAYLCRCFDIVAHETGHAILDALKPRLYNVRTGQAGALHEAFADLMAVFAVLEQPDMCAEVVAEAGGDLRRATLLTSMGREFQAQVAQGDKRNDDDEHQEHGGLRNLNNDLTGATCGKDIYVMCCVFTGFVFDVLVDIFNWERGGNAGGSSSDDLVRTLHLVAGVVRRMVLLAFVNASEEPDFTELAVGMAKAADHAAKFNLDVDLYKRIVDKRRNDRKLAFAGANRRDERVDLGAW